MILIQKYSPEQRDIWNAFVAHAKNGLFLFDRGYMDYHADRFTDHSLMIYDGPRLVALLPASTGNNEFITHGGLTFGGVVTDMHMRTPIMMELFEELIPYVRRIGCQSVVYKAVPSIYQRYPADEDLYALFRNNAELKGRDVSSAIPLSHPLPWSDLPKRMNAKADKAGVTVSESTDYPGFFAMLQTLLKEKYSAEPTHSASEMELLASRFPTQIRLFAASREGSMLAGMIIYEYATVAHTQYIGSVEEGREDGALSAITYRLLTDVYPGKKDWFSFGKSTEQYGNILNENLIRNKEQYGARAIVHDTYVLKV